MEITFSGNTVVVTGVLGAVGSRLALRFIQEGATVVGCFRGEESRFESLKQSVQQELGLKETRLYPCCVDITQFSQVETQVKAIIDRFGPIDVLVNNAGCNESAPFMMIEDEIWKNIVDTNLTGTKNMCAAVSGAMMARRCGSIVNISSVLGQVLGRGASAYAASKAALNRFTQVAAVELGKKNVRVNGVSPGLLKSGMGNELHPNAMQTALARTPLGDLGTVDDIADAVLFIASARASFITGHILVVDGGLSHG